MAARMQIGALFAASIRCHQQLRTSKNSSQVSETKDIKNYHNYEWTRTIAIAKRAFHPNSSLPLILIPNLNLNPSLNRLRVRSFLSCRPVCPPLSARVKSFLAHSHLCSRVISLVGFYMQLTQRYHRRDEPKKLNWIA